MNVFDRKFGHGFLAGVPLTPGIYCFSDAAGTIIYVGKAKRLRRRLSQYRLVTQGRRHRRMRKILNAAHAVSFTPCPSHLDACLLEIRLIQKLRPQWNIAGAYSSQYPYIGLSNEGGTFSFALSAQPEQLDGYQWFGAFRSRDVVGAAFFSLMKLLTYVGHRSRIKLADAPTRPKHTYAFTFHQLPREWAVLWEAFFRGHSRQALETLTFKLLENVGARSRSSELQEKIDALRIFWQEEALPLARAIAQANYRGSYPVPQAERDPLFLQSRLRD